MPRPPVRKSKWNWPPLPKTESNRDWYRLKVIDHGEGISPENLQRVFTPYFTTKNTGDGKRGFGLGLAIARKIVHLHGGNLSITSKEKKGTTVQVDLPSKLNQGQAPGRHAGGRRLEMVAGMRTLLVIAPNNAPGRGRPRRPGRRALSRHRARRACARMNCASLAPAIDACVLDADLTTVEPIRTIERLAPRCCRSCPMILYASDSHRSWEEDAYLLGVNHILTKPVRARLLNSLLDRLFGAERRRQSRRPPNRPGRAPTPERRAPDPGPMPAPHAGIVAQLLLDPLPQPLRRIAAEGVSAAAAGNPRRQPGGHFPAPAAARPGGRG